LELLWTAGLVLDAFERFVAGVFAVALGVATPVGRDALAAVALELVVAAGGCFGRGDVGDTPEDPSLAPTGEHQQPQQKIALHCAGTG
jgi:hypothetical protein